MVWSGMDSKMAKTCYHSHSKILAEASKERVMTYNRRKRSIDSSKVSTAAGLFSTAEETDEEFARKVQEEEQTKALEQQEQERINLEAAQELQQQLDERQIDDIDWNSIVEQNMAGYKMNYFKGMSYDHIRPIFEQEYNKVQTLFKKDIDVVKTKPKRVAEETLLQESFKKLRTAQASSSEPVQEQSIEESRELTGEELKKMLEIVPVEEIRVEALNTKYPIIDWEILTEESRKYWKIIRVSNITDAYQSFEVPTEDMERALWVELKRLYEPDKDDTLWKLQRYMHDPLTWRLYGSCAVHHVSSLRGHDIYMLTEKDYPLTTAVMGLMLSRGLQVEEDSEMARDLVRKIFIEANRPRK
ncbi:hypothetical protein Tco_0719898 [Tanacetum coccineum]